MQMHIKNMDSVPSNRHLKVILAQLWVTSTELMQSHFVVIIVVVVTVVGGIFEPNV